MAQGMASLSRRLLAIPKRVRVAVRPALAQSAEEIVRAAKNLAPVESGDLRSSIGWTFDAAPEGSLSSKAPSDEGGLTATIFAGNRRVIYARWVEFGTAGGKRGERAGVRASDVKQNKRKGRKLYRTHPGTAARPFFWPAFRANKKRATSRIKRAITKAVKAGWTS